MGNRFTLITKDTSVQLNLGKPYEDKSPTNEYGKFGYPGYSLKSKAHHFVNVGANSITQVSGSMKLQAKGNFRVFATLDSAYSSKSWNTFSAARNATVVSGAGQGSAPVPTTGSELELDRWNPLKLWHQVTQNNYDLRLFLGDDSDWVDVATADDEPKKKSKAPLVLKGAAKNEVLGWFPKRAAWTGSKLGVSLRDRSQDLRGEYTKKWCSPLGLIGINFFDMLRLGASYPLGIPKDSNDYPAFTNLNPYKVYPEFLRGIMQFRDLASMLIGLIETNAIVKNLVNVVKAAQGLIKGWGELWQAIGPFSQAALTGDAKSLEDLEMLKGFEAVNEFFRVKVGKAWGDIGENVGDNIAALSPGAKASMVTKECTTATTNQAGKTVTLNTLDLSSCTGAISITCEDNPEEITDALASQDMPATLILNCSLEGRTGPEALHLTCGGDTVILKLSEQGVPYILSRVISIFSGQAPSSVTVSRAGDGIKIETLATGPAEKILIRPLDKDEWKNLGDVTAGLTDAEYQAQTLESFYLLTGSKSPMEAEGYSGSQGLDAVDIDRLLSFIQSAGQTYFTATKVDKTVKIESKHAATPNKPSKVVIKEVGGDIAAAISVAGTAEETKSLDGVTDALSGSLGDALNPLLDTLKYCPAYIKMQFRAIDKSLDEVLQAVIIIPEREVGRVMKSLIPPLSKDNLVGIFGAGGITMGTKGQHMSHAAKGFCFVASGKSLKDPDWPWKSNPFTIGYKALRTVEGVLSLSRYWAKSTPELGPRDLGFRVRAAKDVDLLSGRIASVAAIGKDGFARLLGYNAVDITSMNHIAMAARAEESTVEVMGGHIVIGAANSEDFLDADQFAFSKVKHRSDKERVIEKSRTTGREDYTHDLSDYKDKIKHIAKAKKDASLANRDVEEPEVYAWADHKNLQPAKKDDIVQFPTKRVAVAAQESVTIEVGTYAVMVGPKGVQIFEQTEAPKKSPGAKGWKAPASSVSAHKGSMITVNKSSVEVSFNRGDKDKRSRLCVSNGYTSLEYGGSIIQLDGKKILLTVGGMQAQGLLIDNKGLSLIKSGKTTLIADGKSFGGNIKSTEIPAPLTTPPDQPISKRDTLEEKWLKSLEEEAKKIAEKVAELRKKTMTEVEEVIKKRNEEL